MTQQNLLNMLFRILAMQRRIMGGIVSQFGQTAKTENQKFVYF